MNDSKPSRAQVDANRPTRLDRRKGSYGIDAPVLAAMFIANVVNAVDSESGWPLLGAPAVLACAGCGLYTSRRGKFLVWSDLLDRMQLRGNEWFLDLGCGRGAVLLLAARHLTTGRAAGVDLWRRRDQSGNGSEVTQRNAAAEGVLTE